MAEMVSPCCGAEYTEYHPLYYLIQEELYICSKCKEQFSEPIEDYEYDEQKKESIAEDRADEARDMGE